MTVISDNRHMIGLKAKPRVSIIIPSWSGEIDRLMESISRQTFRSYEVEVVKGVSPAARARNLGVARTQGDILLFIDDDAFFGDRHTLQKLVSLLENNPAVGVAGTSKLAPRNATRLQKAIAHQVPRMVYPVLSQDVESNPPLDGYGFTAVTTTCCAVPRTVFEQVGGFNEDLATGEDTDFFYRVRRAGYAIYIAGNTWVYHDPPSTLTNLARKSFGYGMGHALEARTSPERRMSVLPLDRWYGLLAIPAAILALPVALFVHVYFDPARRIEIGFRPLKTFSTYMVLSGYIYGWFQNKPRKAASTYMGRESHKSHGSRAN
jgi:cellulose synthase/poly-beta-1,6-N-acetylglucosamine synthase-like glycosyltransferase